MPKAWCWRERPHDPGVQLQGVDLRYGTVRALDGVDLRIAVGERVAIIGANGSGKSTPLRVLHGLLRPTEGRVQREGPCARRWCSSGRSRCA